MPYEHIDQLVPHWWVRVTAGVGTGDVALFIKNLTKFQNLRDVSIKISTYTYQTTYTNT